MEAGETTLQKRSFTSTKLLALPSFRATAALTKHDGGPIVDGRESVARDGRATDYGQLSARLIQRSSYHQCVDCDLRV